MAISNFYGGNFVMKDRKKRPFFKHYKKIFANEFKGYNGSRLVKDILAGLTVGAVALPLALAFGAASIESNPTLGIAAGLITAIIAGVVTGLLGGGSFQISGPTGAMTVVLGSIVGGQYGVQGMFVATALAGVILLVAGIFRFGKVIQFIPRPVITGFTSGIAIVIALGQLGNFFGVSLSGETTVDKVVYFFANTLGDINVWAVVFTLVVVAIMFVYPKKWGKVVPSSLVAIILVTILALLMKNVEGFAVNTIGQIPNSIINSETIDFSAIDFGMITSLLGPAFTIAALGMIESLLCGICAANMKKEKFDSNVELIAQGLGNIVIPFFGGVPSTAAIARTSVAIKSGGQTRLTGFVQALFLVVCMFVLSSAIALVPYPALAGVLIVTAIRMNEWKAIKNYFKHKTWDAIIMFMITLVATVCLDLTYAIAIGVVLSLFIMVFKLTKIQIEESEVDNTKVHAYDPDDSHHEKRATVVYLSGALFFANAEEFAKKIRKISDNYDRFIIAMCGVMYVDVSAVSIIEELVEDEMKKGKGFYFTGCKPSIMDPLTKCGFVETVGEENFFPSLDKVLLPN